MTFRPLLIFWSIILGLSAGTAVALEVLGPPQHAGLAPKLPATRPAGAAPQAHVTQAAPAPAHATPNSFDPAPPLRMTSPAIPEPDPALQEPAIDYADRMMPRVADNGRTPAVLYAAAFDPSERHPRVALVLDGAGLDRGLTEQAMKTLPSAIDIAFSAYAPATSAARMAQAARRQGRECLVSIPMEPSGFPANDEGDRALLIGGDPGQNRQDLEWALSNVQGCVGATGASDGLNGERFAESRQAFGDVLSAIDRRGLLYLDPRPLAPPPDDAMPGRMLPRVVDVIIDHSASPEDPSDAAAIDRNLARLEKLALTRGTAIGLAGPPTPVLLDRLAVWAQGLAARGLVLAPLTAIPPPSLPTEAARQ